ncbi:MAG: hypothetical protein HOO99_03210 [Hyphomicrobiaceae bacterium]|nr:hypothetical protein [Hyphomicrobiaceae bacterium]
MHILLGVPALILAVFFAACEVIGTYEFLHAEQGSFNYIVGAGCGIAVAVSMLPVCAAFAWSDRKWLSGWLWALFCLSLACVVLAGFSRTGTATDTAQDARAQSTAKQTQAKDEIPIARKEVTDAQLALTKARSDATAKASDKTCVENCAKILAGTVTSAETELKTARERLDTALTKAGTEPPPKKDSLASRLAAMTWFTEDQIRTFQPLTVPVLSSGLSAALMIFSAWCFGPLRRTQNDRSQSVQANTQAVDLDEAAEEEAPALAAPARTPLALQFTGPGSELVEFASDRIARTDGAELHMRDVLTEYERYCRQQDMEPMDRTAFVRELASLCQRVGIGVRVDGKDAYLIGAAIAA